MESPTGIIPESLMYPEKRVEVKDWLMSQPWPSHHKVTMFQAWAITTGTRPTRIDLQELEATGTDYGL
jgi:hypothetical protein